MGIRRRCCYQGILSSLWIVLSQAFEVSCCILNISQRVNYKQKEENAKEENGGEIHFTPVLLVWILCNVTALRFSLNHTDISQVTTMVTKDSSKVQNIKGFSQSMYTKANGVCKVKHRAHLKDCKKWSGIIKAYKLFLTSIKRLKYEQLIYI